MLDFIDSIIEVVAEIITQFIPFEPEVCICNGKPLRRYSIEHKSQDYTTDKDTGGLPDYKLGHLYSFHQHSTTSYKGNGN